MRLLPDFSGNPHPHAGHQSTLEGRLVTLGSLAADILSDEKTWEVYMKTMVAQRSWWARMVGKEEPDDDESRAARLRDVCSLDIHGAS